MSNTVEYYLQKYPGAKAWPFGDSPELANELAALVIQGRKTATCSAALAYQDGTEAPEPQGYSIILSGEGEPVCVIQTCSLQTIRFSQVDETLAQKEGEGDLSLTYWRREHRKFFERHGLFDENMPLVFEEFILVEVISRQGHR